MNKKKKANNCKKAEESGSGKASANNVEEKSVIIGQNIVNGQKMSTSHHKTMLKNSVQRLGTTIFETIYYR